MPNTQRYWRRRYAEGSPSSAAPQIEVIRSQIWSVLDQVYTRRLSVLDLGCGDGTFWNGHERPFTYAGMDFAWDDEGVEMADALVADLPEMDLVLLVAVLFHTLNPDLLLRRALAASRRYVLLTAHLAPITFQSRDSRRRASRYFWYTPMPAVPRGWQALCTRPLEDPRVGVSLWEKMRGEK